MNVYKPIHAVCVISLALVFLSSAALAQGGRSSISGFVFDPDRRPVTSVWVELRNEYSTVGRVRTDGSGRYTFRGLSHGRYLVKVLPYGTGFQEGSEEVEIAGIGVRGQPVTDSVQKDVYLRASRRAESVPFQTEVVYAQEVPKEAENLYRNAVEDLKSQRVQAAVTGLERAVAVFPQYFMALQRLGIVRLQQELYDEAAETFRMALAINDRCFDCWYGIAYARYSVRKFPETIEATEKAITLNGNSVEANLLLGMAHRLTKNFEKAEQHMKTADKAADGASPEVHWQLALLFGRDMSRYADAADELELYLSHAGDIPNTAEIKTLIKKFREKAKAK